MTKPQPRINGLQVHHLKQRKQWILSSVDKEKQLVKSQKGGARTDNPAQFINDLKTSSDPQDLHSVYLPS